MPRSLWTKTESIQHLEWLCDFKIIFGHHINGGKVESLETRKYKKESAKIINNSLCDVCQSFAVVVSVIVRFVIANICLKFTLYPLQLCRIRINIPKIRVPIYFITSIPSPSSASSTPACDFWFARKFKITIRSTYCSQLGYSNAQNNYTFWISSWFLTMFCIFYLLIFAVLKN